MRGRTCHGLLVLFHLMLLQFQVVLNIQSQSSGQGESILNVGKKSAQMGYTETVLNLTFFKIDIERIDCLYVLPATGLADALRGITKDPEIFTSRIPFPVTVAGEQFEIKSELFDVNSNLVYSDLRTITSFDPSGSSLNKLIPGVISSDTTNGLKVFNLIITTEQTNPKQGLYMLNAARFEFDVSGSGAHTANDATFHIKKGTVSISPLADGGIGGKVYINPSTVLEIKPTAVGNINNVDIGQDGTNHKKGKFTDLEATDSATVPTTTAPATVSATVTSTTLASTPGTVDVVCPLKAPDGWLSINGKRVPYYN